MTPHRGQLILTHPGECHCLMLWKKHKTWMRAHSGSPRIAWYWLSSWKWEQHSQNPASIWHQRVSTCHECQLANLHMAISLWKVDLYICATWEVNIVCISQPLMTKKNRVCLAVTWYAFWSQSEVIFCRHAAMRHIKQLDSGTGMVPQSVAPASS